MNESQRQVYDAIVDFFRKNGYPPTVRDLCASTGILSTSTVQRKLKQLKALGFINGDVRKGRTITINPEATI